MRIQDLYHFEPEGPELDSLADTEASDRIFHADRKNLVKNVAKAFRSWLQFNESAREDCLASRQVLEDLFSKKKFNNRLVLSLASEPLKTHFAEFLAGPAEEWLSNSKINDKQAHLEALAAYREICHSQDAFVRFRVLRSRGN